MTIAAVALAVTGTYPRSLFDLILGLNRWVLRVSAYVGLMTDEYPPFRLDLGGSEPGETLSIPRPPQPGPAGGPPSRPDAGPPAPTAAWTGGRVTSLVLGCMLALVSVGFLGAGGFGVWADLGGRDGAGFVTTPSETFSTSTFALTSDRIDMWAGTPTWTYPSKILGQVRVRVTPVGNGTVFVGLATTADAERYLAGTGRAVVADVGGTPSYRVIQGPGPTSMPADQGFWVTSSEGSGTQTLTWTPREGSWTIVVMNAKGGAGLVVRADAGATVPHLLWVALAVMAVGLLLLLASVAMIVIPVLRASRAQGSRAQGGGVR